VYFEAVVVDLDDRVSGILRGFDHAFDVEVVDSMMIIIATGVVMAVEVCQCVLVLPEKGDELFGVPRVDWSSVA
jgi:hypothetical protein